jgi:hypothetical protein
MFKGRGCVQACIRYSESLVCPHVSASEAKCRQLAWARGERI